MSLLRIFRNLAVLVILAMGYLSLSPTPVAAQSSCRPLGTACTQYGWNAQCCNHYCSPYAHRCCLPFHNMACRSSAQCCSGACLQGRCL